MRTAYQRPKISDVARALGLSVSTVSRALNGYTDVNADTRKRIERQAEKMGYRPSSIGVKLRKGRNKTAGFILPPTRYEFADPVFLAMLAGAEEVLREADIQLLTTTSGGSEDQFPALKRMVESDQVDAMILARVRKDDPRVGYLLRRGIPMSLLGHSTDHPEVPSVEINHGGGAALGVAHVAALGRKRIGHINAPLHYNYAQDRERQFRDACDAAGIGPRSRIELVGDLSELGGYQATMSLLERARPPDAIICANDAMAIGALHAIVQSGLVPGRDISLLGFDDIPVSSLVNPPLTTFRIVFRDLGRRVARHLLAALDGKGDGLAHVEQPVLIQRST